ncbi:MAG TPA: ergothioneine biosynthesis protein EgtB [Pyrinomonadaceae bacterium]|nr:ergothioneine biosynthesis protein EgtB [Pyrinomonadaceae bacterium]
MASTIHDFSRQDTLSIADLYRQVRARTMQIVAPLEIEDYVIQTADFMSPPRWHIGHTSWFFETVLQKHRPGYRVYSEDFLWYFNSYYEGFGARIERPKRGTKSRPTVRETVAYRNHIDEQVLEFLDSADESVLFLVRMGLEHEMQHQELLVYDIKHLLCDQFEPQMKSPPRATVSVEGMVEIEGGLFSIGSQSDDFAWDNEKPVHQVFTRDFEIDKALVSNGDYLAFMRDGGYKNFRWWFSEGWEAVNREQWRAPMYWELHDGEWMIRDFSGLASAESRKEEPVTHVSFFEASAFAKWAGKRLPTEAEWERAACYDARRKTSNAFPWGNTEPDNGKANLFENGYWSVAPIGAFPEGANSYGCHQMIGDVWEWTTSDYVPYPGFKSDFDEYNDKWFVNQKVLRGGSFATPQLHIRSTYRNFFHAHERWMTSGFRCARDV